jgi:hypothetical protein
MNKVLRALRLFALLVSGAVLALPVSAKVSVSALFSNNMVLQAGKAIEIRGKAAKDESIELRFAGQTWLTRADENGLWKIVLVPAKAVIQKESIVLSSAVKNPAAVRYAWSNDPVGNLYNDQNLPLAPFTAQLGRGKAHKGARRDAGIFAKAH